MGLDQTPWGDELRHYTWQENYPDDTSGIKFHFYRMATPMHDHDFFDVFVVTEGTVVHQYNGEEQKLLGVGTLGLARPQDAHCFRTIEGTKSTHFNIMISDPVCRQLCYALGEGFYRSMMQGEGKGLYQLTPCELEHFMHMTDLIMSAPDGQKTALVRCLAVSLISYLSNMYTTAEAMGDSCPTWLADFLAKLKTSEYFLKPISELYKLVPYSRSVLTVRFKALTGETLVSFITRMRMEYACSLLRSSDYPIIDISEAARYESLSHFNHTFKKQIGMSPTEYRKKHSEKR